MNLKEAVAQLRLSVSFVERRTGAELTTDDIVRRLDATERATPDVLDLFAIDRLLAVKHREDDQPCSCDSCMSYGAEDNGADWYRMPVANRIAIRILDGGDSRFAALAKAFGDHATAERATQAEAGLDVSKAWDVTRDAVTELSRDWRTVSDWLDSVMARLPNRLESDYEAVALVSQWTEHYDRLRAVAMGRAALAATPKEPVT